MLLAQLTEVSESVGSRALIALHFQAQRPLMGDVRRLQRDPHEPGLGPRMRLRARRAGDTPAVTFVDYRVRPMILRLFVKTDGTTDDIVPMLRTAVRQADPTGRVTFDEITSLEREVARHLARAADARGHRVHERPARGAARAAVGAVEVEVAAGTAAVGQRRRVAAGVIRRFRSARRRNTPRCRRRALSAEARPERGRLSCTGPRAHRDARRKAHGSAVSLRRGP